MINRSVTNPVIIAQSIATYQVKVYILSGAINISLMQPNTKGAADRMI